MEITLQRHFSRLTKFAHAKSRFCGCNRQEKAVFDVPITLSSTKHVCRNVVVGLQAVKTVDAQVGRQDAYGQRYTVDVLLVWCDKQAIVRSGWIIEHDSDTPRLTTCYPR